MVCRTSIVEAVSIYGDSAPKLIELTRKDIERLFENLRVAVNGADSDGVGLSAHSLKSVLSQVGANDAAAIAFELEKKGKSNDLNGAEGILGNIESEIKETFKVFETIE